jgi:hypothetical protein
MNDNDELDKLARKVNNKNKDIYSQFRDFSSSKKNYDDYAIKIDQFLTGQYDKNTNIEPVTEGFYSAQGEYSNFKSNENILSSNQIINDDQSLLSLDNSQLNTQLTQSIKSINSIEDSEESSYESKHRSKNKLKKKSKNKSKSSNSDNISLESLESKYNHNDISNMFNSDSIDISKIDHEIKTKSKYNNEKYKSNSNRYLCDDFDLRSVDSIESLESGESLLRHIRHCSSCKSKVVDLIKDHKNHKLKELIKNNKIDNTIDNKENNTIDNTIYNNDDNYREIIIAILIGIVIIFIMNFIL